MSQQLRILALEPYFGGSHAAFLEGLVRASRHEFVLLTLPAHNWKWRMRTAPFEMARMFDEVSGPIDLLFCSDFLDLATFVGLRPERLARVRKVTYFHENQITYPVRQEDERDCHFAVTNLTTIHASDAVWFNSAWHRNDFLDGAKKFVRKMPDGEWQAWLKPLEARLRVEPLGLDLAAIDSLPKPSRTGPLRILWNHRWEFDKNPEDFFAALAALEDRGCDFRVAVCGEQFRDWPDVFDRAKLRFADRLVQFGSCATRTEYLRLIRRCDVVVSTAIHEFFGTSVVEAAYAGCYPLLPDRLSYPELLPEGRHKDHLYSDPDDLVERLEVVCRSPEVARCTDWRAHLLQYDWSRRGTAFDKAFEQVVTS